MSHAAAVSRQDNAVLAMVVLSVVPTLPSAAGSRPRTRRAHYRPASRARVRRLVMIQSHVPGGDCRCSGRGLVTAVLHSEKPAWLDTGGLFVGWADGEPGVNPSLLEALAS